VTSGRLSVACLTLAFTTASASAQSYESIGVRAAGMAGAFVAVADDATAAYWNPAALATGRLFTAVVDHRDIEEGGAGTFVGVGMPVVAVTYYRLGATGREDRRSAGVSTHNAGISLVQSLAASVTVGTTLRFVHGTSSAFDVDAGVLAAKGPLRVGVAARNLRRPFDMPRQVRAGLALRADDRLTIALDADLTKTARHGAEWRSLAAGAERAIGARWLARAGIRASTTGQASPVVAFGASTVIWRSLWLDGHAAVGRRDGDRGWGLAARMILGN
jgi:hypothetical protein